MHAPKGSSALSLQIIFDKQKAQDGQKVPIKQKRYLCFLTIVPDNHCGLVLIQLANLCLG